MVLVARLSLIKKICNLKTVRDIEAIYRKNNLSYAFTKYSNSNSINELLKYLKNDKKNNDKKINFILLKKIGKTTLPNTNKISTIELKKYGKTIAQC